ncbi:hypothetical protein EON77_01000 [bacterium]|nr:MAG: hypothetical protein EON77_01000 [bacterium]
MVACDGIRTVQAFHASLATDASQIAGRLYLRVGAAAAGAVIVEGLDPCAPLVEALVSPALIDALTMIAAQPQSPLATGLDLHVEQRFVS